MSASSIPCRQCNQTLNVVNEQEGDYHCPACDKPYRLTTRPPTKGLHCDRCDSECDLIDNTCGHPGFSPDVDLYQCPKCFKQYKKRTNFRYFQEHHQLVETTPAPVYRSVSPVRTVKAVRAAPVYDEYDYGYDHFASHGEVQQLHGSATATERGYSHFGLDHQQKCATPECDRYVIGADMCSMCRHPGGSMRSYAEPVVYEDAPPVARVYRSRGYSPVRTRTTRTYSPVKISHGRTFVEEYPPVVTRTTEPISVVEASPPKAKEVVDLDTSNVSRVSSVRSTSIPRRTYSPVRTSYRRRVPSYSFHELDYDTPTVYRRPRQVSYTHEPVYSRPVTREYSGYYPRRYYRGDSSERDVSVSYTSSKEVEGPSYLCATPGCSSLIRRGRRCSYCKHQ